MQKAIKSAVFVTKHKNSYQRYALFHSAPVHASNLFAPTPVAGAFLLPAMMKASTFNTKPQQVNSKE